MAIENYYKILGIEDFTTDLEKIKNAYKAQIKFYHPDANKVAKEIAEEKTKQLNVAYDTLSNPQRKMAYDSELRYSQNGGYNSQNSNSYTRPTSNTYTYQNYNYRPNNTRYTRKNNKPSFFGWLIIIVMVLAVLGSCEDSTTSSTYTPSNYTPSINTAELFDEGLTPVSVKNGQIIVYPSDERIAPLEIKTSSTSNYYISLQDISHNGRNNMSFYIKGGNTVEIDVPLGTYKIYYATGDTWYGKKDRFGYFTNYYKCDDTFVFDIDGDYVNGYTLTLYSVSNGNMSTDPVSESVFPN